MMDSVEWKLKIVMLKQFLLPLACGVNTVGNSKKKSNLP
jgi:hypothetical protein